MTEGMALTSPDLEMQLVGTIISYPLPAISYLSEIKAEWFAEPLVRVLFEGVSQTLAEHGAISMAGTETLLPEDCDGIERKRFVAACIAAAAPVNTIPSQAATLRGLWARRRLKSVGDTLQEEARAFGAQPADLAGEAIAALDDISTATSEQRRGLIGSGVDDFISDLDDPDGATGATTGFKLLDDAMSGFRPGWFYCIAARPSMGKTAMSLNMARRTSEAGNGVAFFSLEMEQSELYARLFADVISEREQTRLGPTYKALLARRISPHQKAAVEAARDHVKGLPLHCDFTPKMTVSQITSRVRQLKASFEAKGQPLAVVFVDYLGLVTPTTWYRGDKTNETGEISNALRVMAKELDVAVVALSQLNRQVETREDKRPQLSDLRNSGDIEQDCHAVLMLYREYYYAERGGSNLTAYELGAIRDNLDVMIRKNRGGELAEIALQCSIGHNHVYEPVAQANAGGLR